MDKEKITVTLSLAEFDELRRSEESCARLYNQLTKKLEKCFTFDTSEYYSALKKIDDDTSLKKDKDIFAAVKRAQSLISLTVDMDKLKAIAVDLEFDEDINPGNISKTQFQKSQEAKI